ncbi:MAG: peptidoglycan DD-metalloendopeptidase family protein [Clostridiales bacterium]|jgi:murein DD-endopeptidase MepM/ murein hydrolase activator NlpD|nr:peptidoglycan DD-metalloendopeptidase family protein [Clostridiales bacterium]
MRKKLPEDSVFKKKGFFVALYSCVGVVLVLAALVSYNNMNSLNSPPKFSEPPADNVNASLSTPNPDIVSYPADPDAQSQESAEQSAADERALVESETQTDALKKNSASEPPATDKPDVKPLPAPSSSAKPTVTPDKATQDNGKEPASPVFDYFSDNEKMNWPVLGKSGEIEIVMDFSTDHLVYDKTLDQYRTNDSIWISANPGAPVKASYAGVVTKVDKTARDGNTVIIDNGNGWMTTYGQLLDHITVKEGDVVKKDQVIGGVASPTIYGVLLGNHLSFKVEKDNMPVDPKTVLISQN